MPIADAHVDVLWRMLRQGAQFHGDSTLEASYKRLHSSGVTTQVFALFVDPADPDTRQLEDVLLSIDHFYQHVVSPGKVRAVRNQRELSQARSEGVLAGLLSIEGGGCLRGQVELLRVMYHLGVRGMGLTWNLPNAMADGCMEPRGGGLTGAGRDVIAEMARLSMWVDLAHLADRGVEDVFAYSNGPIMASHANARAIHSHPRNLTDDVIKELIRRDGWMGLVFESSFVGKGETVQSEELLRHVDHVLELGGTDILGLGSDFDGATTPLKGLSHAGEFTDFADMLRARYGDHIAHKILFQNFEDFLNRTLPE